MALLHGMAAVNEIHDHPWSLIVAHLDHSLRPESAEDAALVVKAGADLNLPSDTDRIDVRQAARDAGESVEAAARRLRYEFLESVAQRHAANFILTAHHADDQAETVLHRLIRGTSLRGLAGMAESRPISRQSSIALVRPLLGFTRLELAEYVAARGIPYRHDASNDDLRAATRNWIRLELLPLLREKANSDIVAALNRLAVHARRADEALRQISGDALKHASVQQSSSQIRFTSGHLRTLPTAVQSHLIMEALHRLGAAIPEVSMERVEAVVELIEGDDRRRQIELPGGFSAERRGRFVILRRPGAIETEEDILGLDQEAHH